MAASENKENASGPAKYKSKLSLKGQKQARLSDISPAPVPRSSHRIRSSNADADDKQKTSMNSSRKAQSTSSLDQEKLEGILNGINSSGRAVGICPLANLGNTCFLNSVLYALRFLPGFIHDLHHMHTYLQTANSSGGSSSILQRISFLSELHNVFASLNQEEKNYSDTRRVPALHPLQFLESVRSVNPLFEGNHQQDAHELLHCLLDQLCSLPQDSLKASGKVKDAECMKPPRAKRKCRSEKDSPSETEITQSLDVVSSKFMGRMRLETRCIECEQTNSQDESFLEVCVPVKRKIDVDEEEEVTDQEVLLAALCEEESLLGSNKYWCDFCCHHNEAHRSVHYPQLPHHLLIHVKRFSSYSRAFAAKCCDSMPAPLQLPCFCQTCLLEKRILRESDRGTYGVKGRKRKMPPLDLEGDAECHMPYYLTAFVCHLGATISSGHYVSYVRMNSNSLVSCPNQEGGSGSLPKDGVSSDAPSNPEDLKCSFLSCCSSHLDKILPSSYLNGHSDYATSSDSKTVSALNSVWLECDDEKIKVIGSSDIVDIMNSSRMTPYLLFYSR